MSDVNADRLAEIRAAAQDALREGSVESFAARADDVLWLFEWLDRFAQALDFYADPMTYFAIAMIGDAPHGDWFSDFEDVGPSLGEKPGKRARQALDGRDVDA